MKNKNIGIKALSVACGVLPHAIRTWETRYQVFRPSRSEGGQRLYSEDDLEKGKLLSILLNQGHAISKLAKMPIDELERLVDRSPVAIGTEDVKTNISISNLLLSLSQYKIDEMVLELQYLRANCGSKEFIFKVVLPVMQEIGLKVAKGTFTVTQEHIISTLVREQLSQLSIPNTGYEIRRVILATPSGNHHELSILIADIICRANKVPTSYLGAAHPAECLAEAVNALKIHHVILGVVSSDHWDYEKNIISYLKDIDSKLKIKVNVILGGGWKLSFPKFKNIENIIIQESFEDFDKALVGYKIAV